ncbi:MAG: glycosyltransferase [Euryarchaeota archaeon]|nr:glycosyltransferase [Euryarchaeota archaeon]
MSETSDPNKEHPTISIIMNCLNCSRYLKEAIDSIYQQTYTNWEIVFWDNASTDHSAEIARSYDDRLRYFCSENTVPLGHARNFAIERARGKYIAFLDCDDRWLPDKLERQIRIFEDRKDVALLYSDSYIVDSSGNRMKTAFDSENPERGMIFNGLLSKYNFIPLLTVLIKKDVLDEVGYFNPDYNVAEEYDLFLRIAHIHSIDYIDRPLAEYRVHENNLSFSQDIGIREELEIMDRWLLNDPEIRKELGMSIKKKKLKRHAVLLLYYLVKYAHLPKSILRFC